MTAVLDVSAAIEMLYKKEKKQLFDIIYKEAALVLAPDLFISEISNVLWKYHKAKIVSHLDCLQLTEDGINMIDYYIDTKDLWKEALTEGIKFNHSIYDMYYLVTARRNNAIFLTLDASLINLCKQEKIKLAL